MKWIRGYGTRLVWNSVISTFKAPSKRSDADQAVQVGVRGSLDVQVPGAACVCVCLNHLLTKRLKWQSTEGNLSDPHPT